MESLKLLTERIFLRKAIFMYKVSHSLTPVYINDLLNQRNQSKNVPVLRSSCFSSCRLVFLVSGGRKWNSIVLVPDLYLFIYYTTTLISLNDSVENGVTEQFVTVFLGIETT